MVSLIKDDEHRHRYFVSCGNFEALELGKSSEEACANALKNAILDYGKKKIEVSNVILVMDLSKLLEKNIPPRESLEYFETSRVFADIGMHNTSAEVKKLFENTRNFKN